MKEAGANFLLRCS